MHCKQLIPANVKYAIEAMNLGAMAQRDNLPTESCPFDKGENLLLWQAWFKGYYEGVPTHYEVL